MTKQETFSVAVRPTVLRNKGICGLFIENEGERTTTFAISASAAERPLDFQALPESLAVAPGKKGGLCIRVQVPRRPFIGSKRSIPFAIHVSTADGARQTFTALLHAEPHVPPASQVFIGFVISLGGLASAFTYVLSATAF